MACRILILLLLCAFPAFGQSSNFVVKGDIPSPITVSSADFAKLPHQSVSVTEKDGTRTRYDGVPLRDILKQAGAPLEGELRGKALASYVLAGARDGYQVVFTLAELAPDFANETVIVADQRDGKALPEPQGPFRLVWPNDKAGARSVRMLETLQVVKLRK